MADTKIDVDLSPESIVKALREMGEETKRLAQTMEDSLGKKAVDNVDKLQKSAEEGSTKISSFFRNMGQRVREDLRTAFDISGVMAGANLAKEIGEGIRSVFEMEKAFDRLNTRLQLTGRELLDFKKNVGNAVAGTGQRLEDVLPGVERMAARGNVRDPGQLQQMAGMLGQVRATTGEDVGHLADTVVNILRDQGKEINANNTRTVIDTLQSTRTRGAFQTAGEAGGAVSALSPYARQMNLGTQQLGGLAAVASQAGPGGQNILQQLMQSASQIGGAARLNATLGQGVFREGREGQATGMNVEALGRVNMHSPQVMEAITGLTGASGADLQRFVEAFRGGMGKFNEVTRSFGEGQRQFDLATDNFASNVAKFKQATIQASAQIGAGLSAAANALIHGDLAGVGQGLGAAGTSAWNNRGTLAGAGALSAGAGLLAGGGINSLISRLPGMGGAAGRLAGGVAGAAAADAAGIQKVYVVNASEFGGIGGISGMAGGALGMAGGAALAGGVGFGIGTMADAADQATGAHVGNWLQDRFSDVSKMFGGQGIVSDEEINNKLSEADARLMAQAMREGVSNVTLRVNMPLTNPSNVESRGAPQ